MFKDEKEITQSSATTVPDLPDSPDPMFEFMQRTGLLFQQRLPRGI